MGGTATVHIWKTSMEKMVAQDLIINHTCLKYIFVYVLPSNLASPANLFSVFQNKVFG